MKFANSVFRWSAARLGNACRCIFHCCEFQSGGKTAQVTSQPFRVNSSGTLDVVEQIFFRYC